MTTFQNLNQTYKPAPGTSAARAGTDWSKMTNENLKFALDVLSQHQSPFEVDCASEIQTRIEQGVWVDISKPPPPLHNLPKWLVDWLPRSLWRHRP